MKGSGVGYGFDKITEMGALIEVFLKEKNGEKIKKVVNDLCVFLDNIKVVYE